MKSLTKYKLTVEDESHLTEVVSGHFTVPVLVLVIVCVASMMLFLAGLTIAFTPIRTLLPGYLKDSQRSATEEGLMRLDSLMGAYETNRAYIDNYLRITDTDRIPGDSAAVTPTSRDLSSDSLMNPTNAEQKFVSQMEERERFNISVLAPLAAESMMFSPVSGDGIFTKDSQASEEGVVILPHEESVQCAADGSVIALYYSATEHGYVVVVQHNKGFVTSYTHVGTPLVGIGDSVTAGQILALSPAPDSRGMRHFSVRMWHNGLPIIPFEYLGDPVPDRTLSGQSYEAPRGRL